MGMKILLALLYLLCLTGCDQLSANPQPVPKKTRAAKRSVPVHRFVQESFDPAVAFDTQTGQICRTWAWQPAAPVAKYEPDGTHAQRSLGEFAPTCASIYLSSPSQIGDVDEDDK